MDLFSVFRQRENREEPHKFNDNDREKAEIKRKTNALKRKKLKILNDRLTFLNEEYEERALKNKIDDIEDDLYGDEEEEEEEETDSWEEKLGFKLLENVLSGAQEGNGNSKSPDKKNLSELASMDLDEPLPQFERVADEEKIRKMVKVMPNKFKKIIKGLDYPTINRLVQLIKEK